MKHTVSIAAILLLSACAQLPQDSAGLWQPSEQISSFAAEGRLAVKAEGKGSYANFDWTYQPPVETININTPLGSTLGQLCQDRDGALAVDAKGNVYQAESAEELSRQLIGFNLPIQYLHIWADGRRVAHAPYRILSDGILEQYGWTIGRTVNSEGKARILQLDNGKLNIRLVFTEIGMPSETETPERCAARTR
ncbi:lipoprotein insertase outer membrane protein LolB [Neisseria sp. Marseille-Q6792]|uniref:lipoprotein insertase outer membrane protein LolB n=1 Tax=Neisseria sp. Marseille-Q6792 TaxID=2937985 RepID=UPI00202599E4|nr:lipoprotein insertase outer membrane protein LolB [Neisseria sp. Marseille-Q6792]